MMPPARVVLLLLLSLPLAAQSPPEAVRVLTNAHLIDGSGGPGRPGMTIVVRGDRLEDVHAAGERPLPPRAAIMDLTGRTIVPGLVEAHTHLQDFFASRERLLAELERLLHGGVVAIREMAADARVSGELNRAIRLGQIAGPDIYFAAVLMGPHFRGMDGTGAAIAQGAEGDIGWIQSVDAGSDIPLTVARAAGSGARALKLYIEMEPPLVEALTREAHRQGLKVWAHPAVFPSRPLEVVRAGVDGISHACGVAWEDADLDPRRFAKVARTNRPVFDPHVVQADSREMTALFAEMARRGTFFDPTFSMYPRGGPAKFGCAPDLMAALARAAARAGVPMLTGTDWHAPPDAPWPSLHDEIVALVEHGILTPAQAIRAATRHGAEALGILDQTGTIEPGKRADLVILEANPLDDIEAIRRIHAVMKAGQLYRRADYEARRGTGRPRQP